MDNLDPDQTSVAGGKRKRLDEGEEVSQRQSQPAQDSSQSTSADERLEEGVGWGQGRAPDDWGWGLENPTLAAATGSYETELQAQISNTYETDKQTANDTPRDAWDDIEIEDDWADDLASDDTPGPSLDVTALSSTEAVSVHHHQHCSACDEFSADGHASSHPCVHHTESMPMLKCLFNA